MLRDLKGIRMFTKCKSTPFNPAFEYIDTFTNVTLVAISLKTTFSEKSPVIDLLLYFIIDLVPNNGKNFVFKPHFLSVNVSILKRDLL